LKFANDVENRFNSMTLKGILRQEQYKSFESVIDNLSNFLFAPYYLIFEVSPLIEASLTIKLDEE
jgi:hypothetical protein